MTANPTITDVQAEIADDFAFLGDWEERYAHIIELGRSAPPFPAEFKTEDNRVAGCQSQVWLVPRIENGLLHFQAASDALISGGLVQLAVKVYSGHPPADVLHTPPVFIDSIGMKGNISPVRLNGLSSVIKKMKMYALAYQSQQGNPSPSLPEAERV